jgi:hypothetical protein
MKEADKGSEKEANRRGTIFCTLLFYDVVKNEIISFEWIIDEL